VGTKLRKLAALCFAGMCLWAVAPALSTTPYMPPAVDFEQPLGAVKAVDAGKQDADAHAVHLGEGPVTHRSEVIEAPERFDAVGLAGERKPLELRVRLEGDEWSEWIEVGNGDPLYAVGGADEAQLRTRGWRPEGTLHYVNVSGTTSAGESALTSVREAVNSAFISVAGVVSPSAEAGVRKPAFISRKAWGAERDQGGCPPRTQPAYGKVKAGVVHHTVTSNSYSRGEAAGIVLAICRYHRNGNGWNDIGYNALVDRFGRLYAGRDGGLDRAVVGAQAQGYNAQTAGISAIGTHTSVPVSGKTFRGFRNYFAWKLDHHGAGARGTTRLTSTGGDVNRYPNGKKVRVKRIFRHGKVDYTACPGSALTQQIDRLRRETAQRIQESA
jgi:hypothetical protein